MRPHSDKIHRRRRELLDLARDLARSGRHTDHRSIAREMEQMPDVALVQTRFQEYAFRAQLDRMCRMAREDKSTGQDPGTLPKA